MAQSHEGSNPFKRPAYDLSSPKRQRETDVAENQANKRLASLADRKPRQLHTSRFDAETAVFTADYFQPRKDEQEFFDAQERFSSPFGKSNEKSNSTAFTGTIIDITDTTDDEDSHESSGNEERRSMEHNNRTGDGASHAHDHEHSDSRSSKTLSRESTEESDLFAKTFGNQARRTSVDAVDDNDEDDETTSLTLSVANSAPHNQKQLQQRKQQQQQRQQQRAQQDRQQQQNPQPPSQTQENPEDLFLRAIRAQGYDFVPCEHSPGCTCDPIRRLSTPPAQPNPYKPNALPPLPGAMSKAMIAHYRFHLRVHRLLPQRTLHGGSSGGGGSFDAGRRYWIAVLLDGKKPENAHSEREFIWMKGNRFSTVATVWHSYQTTTMADPDDLVLLLGRERVEMKDQMQQLDYFDDRFVVFRAVRKAHALSEEKSLAHGVVPIIELD